MQKIPAIASAAGNLTSAKEITRIAGFEGIICGFSAIYLAIAEVLNESYNREVLPVYAVKK